MSDARAATNPHPALNTAPHSAGGEANEEEAVSGHAELARVWPRDGALRLTGGVCGARPGVGPRCWSLVLTLREGADGRLRYPAPLDGCRFDVTLPVADLAPDGLALPACWDAWLAAEPETVGGRLRVGRLLDGVEGKKRVMVFPGQPVVRAGGTALVTPYFTVKDNLSVEVTAVP